jgi:hypothetical protein
VQTIVQPRPSTASAAAIATVIPLLLTAPGCARSVVLGRDQLQALTTRSSITRVVVSQAGEQIRVDDRHDPQVVLQFHCSFREFRDEFLRAVNLCDAGLSGPLDAFHVESDRIRLQAIPGKDIGQPALRGVTRSPDGDYFVDPERVSKIELRLHNYQRPGWRPRWGLGFSVGGAGVVMSVTGQYRPVRFLALELGLVPPAPGVAAGWTGFRVLAPRWGPLQLFAGGFAFGAAMTGETDVGPGPPAALAGARLGFDVFASEQHVVSLEVDGMWRLDRVPGKVVTCEVDRVCPWGGISYAYLW